jgi:hypothetical protein
MRARLNPWSLAWCCQPSFRSSFDCCFEGVHFLRPKLQWLFTLWPSSRPSSCRTISSKLVTQDVIPPQAHWFLTERTSANREWRNGVSTYYTLHVCAVFLQLSTSDACIQGACQVGSGAFGEWFWWLYMIVNSSLILQLLRTDSIVKIPLFAVFKLWTSVISPLVLGRGSPASADDTQEKGPATSKRQEKLRKRQEKGEPRIRPQSGRK